MVLKWLGICTVAGAVLAYAVVPSKAAPALNPGLSKAPSVALVVRGRGGGGGGKFGGGGFRGGGRSFGAHAFRGGGGFARSFRGGGRGLARSFGGGGRRFSHGHGVRQRFSSYSYHGGRYALHHGRRHHRYRGYAFYGVPYVYGWYGGYGYSCAWLRERALLTDSPYWWNRYYDSCGDDYFD